MLDFLRITRMTLSNQGGTKGIHGSNLPKDNADVDRGATQEPCFTTLLAICSSRRCSENIRVGKIERPAPLHAKLSRATCVKRTASMRRCCMRPVLGRVVIHPVQMCMRTSHLSVCRKNCTRVLTGSKISRCASRHRGFDR